MTRTLVAFSDPLPAEIDFRYVGEFVTNDNGSFSLKILFAPPLDGTGDWLSLDEFGVYHRRGGHGGPDEQFRATDQGGYVAAGQRGIAEAPPLFVPMQTWTTA